MQYPSRLGPARPTRWSLRPRHSVLILSAVALVASGATVLPAAAAPREGSDVPSVTFSVDATQGHLAISPLIYGINMDKTLDPKGFASIMSEARPGTVRLGGNRWTAYNWENNASNAGSDYEYENDNYLASSTTPGAAVLGTVLADQKASIPTLLTIPIAGYVSADVAPPGPVSKSGPNYLSTRFRVDKPSMPRPLSAKPNTKDQFVYQDQFVYWLTKTAPKATLMFSLDNEPDLWSATHREIHPKATTYAELLSKDLAYAAAVKKVDPSALVTGPANYGWEGYYNLQEAPGYQKYGTFLEWWMRQVHAADQKAGQVLINDLDLHFYSDAMAGDQAVDSDSVSPDVASAREQAPRSLWDPTYVEDSWITKDFLNNKSLDLIPRVVGWIARDNPGMNLDFSEWDYGASQDISGAIATADALGIFGRYGVHAADWFPLSEDNAYAYGAFAMFRNYDGQGGAFGDTEVQAATTDPVNTSVYASIDSGDPNHKVIVAINKATNPVTAEVQVKGLDVISPDSYVLTSASPLPQKGASPTGDGNGTFSYTMPAQSISVLLPQLAQS